MSPTDGSEEQDQTPPSRSTEGEAADPGLVIFGIPILTVLSRVGRMSILLHSLLL